MTHTTAPTAAQLTAWSDRLMNVACRIDAADAVLSKLQEDIESDFSLYGLCTAIRACLEDAAAEMNEVGNSLGEMGRRAHIGGDKC